MKYPCPNCGKSLRKGTPTPAGKPRWVCRDGGGDRKHCYSTTSPTSPKRGQDSRPRAKAPVFKRELGSTVKRYLITSAQNATPIHENFLASLLQAAKYYDAELLVIPLRYKNPTSRWTESQENAEWWLDRPRLDPKTGQFVPGPRQEYLWNVRRSLNPNLTLLADVKTQPTASDPLRGFEALSLGESGILGHTKLQMRMIPTPSHRYPKMMTTTGAVTVPNYTDSRAGKLGEFHHCLGALIVEIDGKAFHLRHLNANKSTGAFTDIDTTFTPEGAFEAERAIALIMGDTHVDYICPRVERATFGEGGILNTVNPKYLVWHDLLDGYSANPHHKNNPFLSSAKRDRGLDLIRPEIDRAVQYVLCHTKGDRESLVVSSNHNDFVRRYMLTQDWREDPSNAAFYLQTALHLVGQMKIGPSGFEMPDPFAYWFDLLSSGKNKNVRVLGSEESFTRAGVEMAMHGDRGPNGSRGSARNLRRIGVRSVIGHSHSPAIEEGCYQVGTSTALKLEYNTGPSAWLNTHCILHHDGKRQLISVIDGSWRL
jgi:hypothetical protein